MRKKDKDMTKYFVALEYWEKEQNSTGYFWAEALDAMRTEGLNVDLIHPQRRGSKQPTKQYIRYQSSLIRIIKKFTLSASLAMSILFRAGKSDCVICGTNPELLLSLIVLVQKLKRYRIVALVHDVFPENTLATGVVRSQSLIYRMLRSAYSWVYRQPDKMVVIGRDMKELIEREKRRTKSTVFIPNWVDHKDVTPIERPESAILNDLGWQEKTVFQFYGNIGRLQGIDNLLMGIDQVEHPRAAFLFVGSGVQASAVQQYCQDHPARAVKYFDTIPNASRSDMLGACDVALVSLGVGMYGLGVPSKAYFAMASDRPILAVVDEGSEIDLIIAQEQIGWACRPGSPQDFAHAINEICNGGLRSIVRSPRRALLAGYSKDSSLDQFVTFVKEI